MKISFTKAIKGILVLLLLTGSLLSAPMPFPRFNREKDISGEYLEYWGSGVLNQTTLSPNGNYEYISYINNGEIEFKFIGIWSCKNKILQLTTLKEIRDGKTINCRSVFLIKIKNISHNEIHGTHGMAKVIFIRK